MFGHDLIEAFSDFQDLSGLNVDFSGLPLKSAHGLVNHDPCIREGESLAFGSGGEQESSHAGGLSQADGIDRRFHILHGIVNTQSCRDTSPGGIDVEIDVLFRVLRFEKQELGNNQVGENIVDRRAKEYDPVFQQSGVNVISAFTSVRRLDHNGDKHARRSFPLGRLPKKSVSVVLASFRSSTYPRRYASGLHSLRPCWTAFVSPLRPHKVFPQSVALPEEAVRGKPAPLRTIPESPHCGRRNPGLYPPKFWCVN